MNILSVQAKVEGGFVVKHLVATDNGPQEWETSVSANNPDVVAWMLEGGNLNPPDPAQSIAENISLLWQAAHNYEYAHINGMGVALLTVGVLQGKQKSLAIQQWSATIWDLYYERKALVTEVLNPVLQDFSSVGPMPYSIPELRAEVGM